MKICTTCKQELPLEEFYKNSNRRDGFYNVCKTCVKIERKKYYQKNKEKLKPYYEKYRAENKEVIKLRDKRYCKKNKEKIAEKHRKYILKNKEKFDEYHKQYRRNNLDKFKINRHKYEARKKQLKNTLTQQQWLDNLGYFNNSCAYCGDSKARLSQDHIIPVVKRGPYVKWNIIPACKSCNSQKRTRDLRDFVENEKVLLKIHEFMQYCGESAQFAAMRS